MLDVQTNRKAYGFEIWISPTVGNVYCRTTYSLSVLKMVSKCELSKLNKLLYDARHEA